MLKAIGRLLEVLFSTGVLFLFFSCQSFAFSQSAYPDCLGGWLWDSRGPWALYAFSLVIFLFCLLLFSRDRSRHFVRVGILTVGAYLLADSFFWMKQGTTVSLTEWLADSFFAWRLLVYLAFAFLFFHFGFRLILRLKNGWRIFTGAILLVVFFSMFFGLISLAAYLYEHRRYEHQSVFKDNPLGEKLQLKINSIRDLVISAENEIPELKAINEVHREGKAFDPNSYFSVLTNVHMQTDYTLDYIYRLDALGGGPVLYAKNCQDPSDIKEIDLNDNWYLKVQANDTEQGYLEYATLYLLADQFYLHWHDNRRVFDVIASKTAMDQLINRPESSFGGSFGVNLKKMACAVDLRPYVFLNEDVVTVSLLTFSNWNGFERVVLGINRKFPHRILSEERTTVIKYNSGIIF